MELDKRLVRFLLQIRLWLLDMGDKGRGHSCVRNYVARLHKTTLVIAVRLSLALQLTFLAR